MKNNCFLWFHKWERWSELKEGTSKRAMDGMEFKVMIQHRRCKICNKIQLRQA